MKIAFVVYGAENLGIEYLSSALCQKGHQVKQIFEPGLFSESNPILKGIFSQKKKIIAEIQKFKPQLIGFSVVTSTYQWACQLAQEIKQVSDIPIIFGGYHASAAPEQVLSNACVDLLCIGEGEEAICELVNSMEQGKLSRQIRNIWFKDKSGIIRNPLRPLISDLDQLAFPDKSIYQDVPLIYSKYMVMASRGCPFSCTFCGNSFLHELYPSSGQAIRRRSVENVLTELKEAKVKYRYKKVLFVDDAFGQNRQWTREFLKKYKQEINVPFFCNPHVLYLDQELICLLKDAGCFLMQTGVETVAEGYRKEILHRPETNAHIEFVLGACKKIGLKVQVDHMFGLPLQGEKEQQLAAEFYNRTRPDSIACFRFTYYPGTKMIELAKAKGWLTEDEIQSIQEGRVADYGDHRSDILGRKYQGSSLMYKNFLVLFKLLPLLPQGVIRWIIAKRFYKFFSIVPYNSIDLLRMVSMLKKHDHLFFAYYKYFFYQVIKRLFLKSKPL